MGWMDGWMEHGGSQQAQGTKDMGHGDQGKRENGNGNIWGGGVEGSWHWQRWAVVDEKGQPQQVLW